MDGGVAHVEGAAVSSTPLRAEFVENARRFFKNPKIRSTPLDEQRQFLLGKGVTQAEIAEALRTIPAHELSANQAVAAHNEVVAPLVHPPPPRTAFALLQSALVVGGASYLAYRFVRSWLLPRFFDIADPADAEVRALRTQLHELQNTTKFVMETSSQTLETVAAQQEQLNRALKLFSTQSGKDGELQRMQNDLSVVKSLLLRSDQFPSVASANGVGSQNGDLDRTRSAKSLHSFNTQVPAWQRANSGDTAADDTPSPSTTLERSDSREAEL